MTRQTIEPYVNPSDETIRLGPLAVRFLVTGEDSNGSIATFELSAGCEGALRHHAGGDRSAGPSEDGGDHASLWPHAGSASRPGVMLAN
jgi:hypothetical protein